MKRGRSYSCTAVITCLLFATPCFAHDSSSLVEAVFLVLLLPVPATWFMLGWRKAALVVPLMWVVAACTIPLEHFLVSTLHISVQSGLVATLLLFSPNLVLPIYLVARRWKRRKCVTDLVRFR
jgi:hypothetical protein